MKTNIITYLQTYGQETFSERAFGEVDALILCQFSYLKFDGIIPRMPGWPAGNGGQDGNQAAGAKNAGRAQDMVTILDIWRNPNRERMFYDTRFEEENRALAEQMLLSKRFQNARFGLFLDFIDDKEQYSSVP